MRTLTSASAVELARLGSVFAIALLASLILPPQARAFDQLELDLGSLEAADWQAEGLSFKLDWDDPQTSYSLKIDRLRLPALSRELSGVSIECRQGAIESRRIACADGRLTLPDPLLDNAGIDMSFDFDPVSGRLAGTLKRVAVVGGTIDVDFQLDAEGWRLRGRGHGLQARMLVSHWPELRGFLADWSLAGRIELDTQLAGRGDKLQRAQWQGRLSDLSLGDASGLYAGEGLALASRGELTPRGSGWRIDSAWQLSEGELLTPGFYLDASTHPLELKGMVLPNADFTTLGLRDVRLNSPDLLDLRLEGELRPSNEKPVAQLKLRLEPVRMAALYGELLQPVLAGTPWGRFETAGEVELSVDAAGEAMGVTLGLRDFSLDDAEGEEGARRLGLYDVNGRLHWRRGAEAEPSEISWRAGHLLEHIGIGPGEVAFQTHDHSLRLLRQARVPVLDGALVVDKLELQELGSEKQRLQFDGFIEPISMATLSQALDWVPLSGKLSGMLPGLRYEQGLLSVDGVLLVRIFDGDILLKQLQTRDLFGVYPQLNADIELHNLDLESLTHTFSFGRITGRLDGYVRKLRMEDWSPVAFDARFFTPDGDDSRHRISQKAVDNISNLGGAGMSGALARSFMRFFEEFGYKRIGIGCRLSNGVCDMVGAGPAKQGYYLVEGSGLPRIDIIGFNTTADWDGLVEQLKQIVASGPPMIE